MSIKKRSSRNADRVKIKKMTAQGFSYGQISEALSITEDHVKYVVEQYEDDLKQRRKDAAAAKELQAMRDAEERAAQQARIGQPENAPQPASEAAVAARVEAEVAKRLDEEVARQVALALEAQKNPEPEAPSAETQEEDPATDEEAETKPRRRRRKAA